MQRQKQKQQKQQQQQQEQQPQHLAAVHAVLGFPGHLIGISGSTRRVGASSSPSFCGRVNNDDDDDDDDGDDDDDDYDDCQDDDNHDDDYDCYCGGDSDGERRTYVRGVEYDDDSSDDNTEYKSPLCTHLPCSPPLPSASPPFAPLSTTVAYRCTCKALRLISSADAHALNSATKHGPCASYLRSFVSAVQRHRRRRACTCTCRFTRLLYPLAIADATKRILLDHFGVVAEAEAEEKKRSHRRCLDQTAEKANVNTIMGECVANRLLVETAVSSSRLRIVACVVSSLVGKHCNHAQGQFVVVGEGNQQEQETETKTKGAGFDRGCGCIDVLHNQLAQYGYGGEGDATADANACAGQGQNQDNGMRDGNDAARVALECLFDAAISVLWNQISCWSEQGILIDPHKEFFIEDTLSSNADQKNNWTKDEGKSQYKKHNIVCDLKNEDEDENEEEEEEEEQERKEKMQNRSELHRFVLKSEKIPLSCVSLSTAHRVLFVGQAVRILKRYGNDSSNSGTTLSNFATSMRTQWSCKSAKSTPMPWTRSSSSLSSSSSSSSPSSSAARYMELAIDKMHDNTSRQLYHLLLHRCNLLRHVYHMRMSYLMGDGLFYTELCKRCEQMRDRSIREPMSAEAIGMTTTIIEHGPSQSSSRRRRRRRNKKTWWFHNRIVLPTWNLLYKLELAEVYHDDCISPDHFVHGADGEHDENNVDVTGADSSSSSSLSLSSSYSYSSVANKGPSRLARCLRFCLSSPPSPSIKGSTSNPDPFASGKLLAISLFHESQKDVADAIASTTASSSSYYYYYSSGKPPHVYRTRLALCDVHGSVMAALSSDVGLIGSASTEPPGIMTTMAETATAKTEAEAEAEAEDSSGGGMCNSQTLFVDLNYIAPEPIRMLLLRPDIVNGTYGASFRKLWALRKGLSELGRCWRCIATSSFSSSSSSSPLGVWSSRVCALRSRMEFLILSFVSHFQVDVIESSMAAFRTSVSSFSSSSSSSSNSNSNSNSNSLDRYENLQDAHGRFAACLRRGLFLDDVVVWDALDRILVLVHRLSVFVRRMDHVASAVGDGNNDNDNGSSDDDDDDDDDDGKGDDFVSTVITLEMNRLAARFDLETSTLYKLLRTMDASSRLCARLNFSGWYTR